LAVHTGLRRSEVLGLQWRDLDLDGGGRREARGGSLVVQHSAVLVGDELRLVDGAKRGGHTLALSATCTEALRALRTRQLEMRLELGPLWQDHDLVFAGPLGGPVH